MPAIRRERPAKRMGIDSWELISCAPDLTVQEEKEARRWIKPDIT
jgi:hypothetical protein